MEKNLWSSSASFHIIKGLFVFGLIVCIIKIQQLEFLQYTSISITSLLSGVIAFHYKEYGLGLLLILFGLMIYSTVFTKL